MKRTNMLVWIIAINGEEHITAQGVIDELNRHQTPRGKSYTKISLCIRKSYQRTDLEEIRSRFDQVRPVVSHLDPNKPPTPNNIGEGLNVPQRQILKNSYFFQYNNNRIVSLLPYPILI